MMRWALTGIVLVLLSGCGFLGWDVYDRREAYLEAESIPRVTIPESLDEPPFEDLLVVPNVLDPRQIAGQKLKLGLPEALSTTYGVDQIVIKRLGEDRWVFVDSPPSMVWPKIRGFFAANRIPLRRTDPASGVMETEWLLADGDTPQAVLENLKRSRANRNAKSQHKFQVRLEAGLRPGSTEVYLEHRQLPAGLPIRSDAVQWNNVSDDDALEGVLLSDIAYYLGDHINASPAFSAMASNVGTGQKAELILDSTKPVLKYRLSFERAWATVGDALDSARISVEDLDRNAATYYVYYDDSETREPGFFRRLFSRDDKLPLPGSAYRYEVHLDNSAKPTEVHVVVKKDDATLADALIAEKLLKIIKQYST